MSTTVVMSKQVSAYFTVLKRQELEESRTVEVEKRKKISTSSESDTSPTVKPNKKKIYAEDIDMSGDKSLSKLHEMINAIDQKLSRTSTRDDIEALSGKFEQRLEKIEGRIFDIAQEIDSLKQNLSTVRQENQSLRDQNAALKTRLLKIESQQKMRRSSTEDVGIYESST